MWNEQGGFDEEYVGDWKAAKLEDIIEMLDDLEEKYHGLDIYGNDIRLNSENAINILENIFRVQNNYPDEIKLLSDPKTSEYNKGFNKGVRSIIWLIYGSQIEGTEDALKRFPRIP